MHKKRTGIDVFRGISNPLGSKGGKKGQVTIFIILGILLVLALILVIALKSEVLVFKPEELIPTEKGKVENFITTCIEDLGREALDLLGEQGGYLNLPDYIAEDATLYLQTSPLNKVPYWAYGMNTNIPTLDEIKVRIDRYLETNLRGCLFEEEAFQESYDLIEKSDLTANTEIVESKVIFNVHWDIEVKNKAGETITELIDHVAESPVKLKRLHQTATKIVEAELDTFKLEDLTQDLLALDHPKVPFSGIELQCHKKEWRAAEAKSTLQDMLRVNLKQLRIKGTEFVEFPESLPYYKNHYVWDLGDDFGVSDVGVVFNYDNNYPFTFQVSPNEGGKMRSGMVGGTNMISFLCIQIWKFVYDVNYPVVVRLIDETTGYEFDIALTVHLVRNLPGREKPVYARPTAVVDYLTDERYCAHRYIPMTVLTFEKVDNGQEINYREPLEEVKVSFTCLKYRCEMGESDALYSGVYLAGINTAFPQCIGGILRGEKEGYKETGEQVTTDSGQTIELNLVPFLKIPLSKIKVVKHEVREVEGEISFSDEKPLGSKETALLRLTFLQEGKEFHQTEHVLGGEVEAGLLEQVELELLGKADYTYQLEITLFDGEKIIGGYQGEWTAPFEQLEAVQQIVFHTVTKDTSDEDQLLELFTNLKSYSANENLPKPEVR